MSTEIMDLATAVAAELGDDWTATARHDYAAKLTNGNVEMFARVGTYGADRGRVVFSTSYPDGWTDVLNDYRDDGYRVSSTVALDRSPAAVAKQLRRTVLPAVEHWTPIVRERLAARADAEANRQQAAERIAGIIPGSSHRNGGTDVSLYPGGDWYGDVRLRHDGTRGDLDLRGLPLDVIASILELAKGADVSSS